MQIRDKATISTRRTLPDGSLQVDAVFARTGIQTYTAGELGKTDRKPTDIIKVWRPAAEVFKQEAINSFAAVALTIDHPTVDVTPENFADLAHGITGDAPFRDGHQLKGRITFKTRKAIDKLATASGELSNGYDCSLEWTSGVIPAGEHDAGQTYDAIQRNIIGNHIALVDAGRCGAECRVQDTQPPADHGKAPCSCEGDSQMADGLIKKVVDGFGLVEMTSDAAAVIDALVGKAASLQTQLDTAAGTVAAKDQAHTEALAAKDAEIKTLKDGALDAAALDARVAVRAQLITDAKRIGGPALVVDGLSDLEVQKAAVTAKMGDEKVKGWNDTQFAGAFAYMATLDATAAEEPATPQSGGLRDAVRSDPVAARDAKAPSYEDRMASRWNTSQKKVA